MKKSLFFLICCNFLVAEGVPPFQTSPTSPTRTGDHDAALRGGVPVYQTNGSGMSQQKRNDLGNEYLRNEGSQNTMPSLENSRTDSTLHSIYGKPPTDGNSSSLKRSQSQSGVQRITGNQNSGHSRLKRPSNMTVIPESKKNGSNLEMTRKKKRPSTASAAPDVEDTKSTELQESATTNKTASDQVSVRDTLATKQRKQNTDKTLAENTLTKMIESYKLDATDANGLQKALEIVTKNNAQRDSSKILDERLKTKDQLINQLRSQNEALERRNKEQETKSKEKEEQLLSTNAKLNLEKDKALVSVAELQTKVQQQTSVFEKREKDLEMKYQGKYKALKSDYDGKIASQNEELVRIQNENEKLTEKVAIVDELNGRIKTFEVEQNSREKNLLQSLADVISSVSGKTPGLKALAGGATAIESVSTIDGFKSAFTTFMTNMATMAIESNQKQKEQEEEIANLKKQLTNATAAANEKLIQFERDKEIFNKQFQDGLGQMQKLKEDLMQQQENNVKALADNRMKSISYNGNRGSFTDQKETLKYEGEMDSSTERAHGHGKLTFLSCSGTLEGVFNQGFLDLSKEITLRSGFSLKTYNYSFSNNFDIADFSNIKTVSRQLSDWVFSKGSSGFIFRPNSVYFGGLNGSNKEDGQGTKLYTGGKVEKGYFRGGNFQGSK